MDNKFTILILKELAAEISQSELQALNQWRNASEENEMAYIDFKQVWELSEKVDDTVEVDVDHEFTRFNQRINAPKPKVASAKTRSLFPRGLIRAASILFLLAGSYFVYQQMQQPVADWTTVVAQNEKQSITLPDQSTVWLNQGATLSYETPFNNRNIKLMGEAYFDVQKMSDSPFIILAGNTKTQVLGTTFNVRANADEQIVEVVVFSGKVSFDALNDDENEILLLPDEKGVFNKTAKTISKQENENLNVRAWQTERLEFDGTKLGEIIPMMEDFYNIQITTSNPTIHNCSFTGVFEKLTPAEAIESIAFGLDLEQSIKNGSFQLIGEGCPQ